MSRTARMSWQLRKARRAVARGGLLAYPTEAVVGLGCDPFNGAAARRLLALKRRSAAQGLIVIGASLEQLAPLFGPLSAAERARLREAWPGPTTFLVPAAAWVPAWLTGASGRIAVRVPDHALARALCRQCGPLVSTSANRHGARPARSVLEARFRFGAAIDVYCPGATGGRRTPSRIVELRGGAVLRP